MPDAKRVMEKFATSINLFFLESRLKVKGFHTGER
jgi:hypothetical protein